MSEWKTVRLGDVCEQISGEWGQDCIKKGTGTKVLRTTNFTNIGIIKYGDVMERSIPQSKIDAKHLKKGDIILEKSGGSDTQPVGRVVYFDRDDDIFLCNNFTTALRISDKNIHPKYIFDYMFYMHKVGITEYYQNKTTGIRNLQTKAYLDRKILLPALETQKHIAAVLDKCTAVITKHKQLLEKYDTLIKSLFIEMFGDEPTENGKWKVEKLGDTGSCKNGMNFHYDENGFEIHCLGVSDFKDNAVIADCKMLPKISLNEKPSEEYLLDKDDIVFVRSNGNKELVGRSVIVYPSVPTTFSGFCIRYRKNCDNLNSIFLLRYLKTDYARKRMSGRGANIQNLNQQILSALSIPVPPLALQNQFAAFVRHIDKSKFAVQKSLEKTETLYKSLMQEYFG